MNEFVVWVPPAEEPKPIIRYNVTTEDAPTGKIDSISMFGEVKVLFNQRMVLPSENATLTDDELELFVVTEGDTFDPEKIILKWNLTNYNPRSMVL